MQHMVSPGLKEPDTSKIETHVSHRVSRFFVCCCEMTARKKNLPWLFEMYELLQHLQRSLEGAHRLPSSWEGMNEVR
jgi:hypothetical protein